MFRYIVLLCCAPVLFAQTQEVETILKESQAAWNRGDLVSFASHYDDSPETTFIGREVVRGGVEAILARYRRAYPSRDGGDASGRFTLILQRRLGVWKIIHDHTS